MAAHQNVLRSCPKSIPLPTMASVFHAHDVQWIVYWCEISKFLEKGISPTDFDVFAETVSGGQFIKSQMTSVVVNKGASLYIPAGSMWAATYMEVDKYAEHFSKQDEDEDSDNEEKKEN